MKGWIKSKLYLLNSSTCCDNGYNGTDEIYNYVIWSVFILKIKECSNLSFILKSRNIQFTTQATAIQTEIKKGTGYIL